MHVEIPILVFIAMVLKLACSIQRPKSKLWVHGVSFCFCRNDQLHVSPCSPLGGVMPSLMLGGSFSNVPLGPALVKDLLSLDTVEATYRR
jgi:hypothetical protein